ncbi:MAG: Fic family protein [Clostridia bacterium]
MEYMTIKEASEKWSIGERRIRKLIQDGRVEGAVKQGMNWTIPKDKSKPIDKRNKIEDNIIFNIENSLLQEIDCMKEKLDSKRPLSKVTVESLKNNFNLQFTYNSNAIEGNTLTLSETRVVLEGITVGGKTIKEHLEAINHKDAILYLEQIVEENEELSELEIRNIHRLVLKEIDNENAGKYRNCNVVILGTEHIPPDYTVVKEKMEELILRYKDWCKKYHPIIVSALLHGEFVKIHPFSDGNGRTARLLMNFEIIRNGYTPVIIKNEIRSKYYDALDKAHNTGDYTDFIELAINSVKDSLTNYLKLV